MCASSQINYQANIQYVISHEQHTRKFTDTHCALNFISVFCFVQYILQPQKYSLLNTRSDFLYTGLKYEFTSRKWLQNVTLLVHWLCYNLCKFPLHHSKTFRLDHTPVTFGLSTISPASEHAAQRMLCAQSFSNKPIASLASKRCSVSSTKPNHIHAHGPSCEVHIIVVQFYQTWILTDL